MYCGEHNGRETRREREGNGRKIGGRWEGGERPRGEREGGEKGVNAVDGVNGVDKKKDEKGGNGEMNGAKC